MPHFFIKSNDINNDIVTISDKNNYTHIARALRIKCGEELLLIDENKIEYKTIVSNVTNSEITAKIIDRHKSERVLPFDIYLAQSPLRSDAQSFIIEKATELGVRGVYPVHTDNCAVNKDTINKKVEKWQKIMYEASKQCERADIPECFAPENIENIIGKFDKVIVFCERIATKTLKEIKKPQKGDKILVIIGPEGGFSEREFKFFKDKNLEMLTLGNLILKAETAATVALGNIIYEFTS